MNECRVLSDAIDQSINSIFEKKNRFCCMYDMLAKY